MNSENSQASGGSETGSARRSQTRNRLRTLFNLALAFAGLWYAFWNVEFGGIAVKLALFSLGPVLAMLGVVFASLFAMALRVDYLAEHRVGFTKAMQLTLIGQGMNNILPARLGEVVKINSMRLLSGVPRPKGLEIVFWERFADLNVLLGLAGYALWATGKSMFLLPLATIVAGVWVVLYATYRHGPACLSLLLRLPWPSLRRLALDFYSQIPRRSRWQFLLGLGAYSVPVWASIIILTQLAFWAAGITLDFPQCIAITVISSLGIAVPGAPGGLGAYEAAVVASAQWFGVDKVSALALAVVLRAVQYIPVTLLGVTALVASGMSLEGLKKNQDKP